MTKAMRYDEAFKRKTVQAADKRGDRTMEQVANDHNVSISQIYRWKSEGFGAVPATAAPKRQVNAAPKAVREVPLRTQAKAKPKPAAVAATAAAAEPDPFDVLAKVLRMVEPLEPETRERVFSAVEALAPLSPPMRARIVSWVRDRFAPKPEQPAAEPATNGAGIAQEHWQ